MNALLGCLTGLVALWGLPSFAKRLCKLANAHEQDVRETIVATRVIRYIGCAGIIIGMLSSNDITTAMSQSIAEIISNFQTQVNP